MRNVSAFLFAILALFPPFGSLTFALTTNPIPQPQNLPQGTRDGSHEPIDFLSRQLNLTADQREKLRVVLENAARDIEAANSDASLSEEAKRDRLKQINGSKREQMNAILTPEQQQKLMQLQSHGRPDQPPNRRQDGSRTNAPGSDRSPGAGPVAPTSGSSFSATPLIDFAPGQKYLGQFAGLLYDGSNLPPAAHDARGKEAAAQIQPLDKTGAPSPNGKIGFLSIGFSNPKLKWCGPDLRPPQDCFEQSFTKQALASPTVNRSSVVILNGAIGGQPTREWGDPNGRDYALVRDRVLTPAGVTETQIQAVWMEIVEPSPTISLPGKNADAYTLVSLAGDACRALKARYPNLKQLFISPRSYGGYARAGSPEPFAYETGFTVKWLIQAQINQMATGHIDERAGDLNSKAGATSWITWGPYFWASGTMKRSDGLSYGRSDFRDTDGLHPSFQGIGKIAAFMLNWFQNSPYTPWFKTH